MDTAEVEAAKARVRATYNAAATHFDAPELGFWDRLGARTVAHAGIAAGERVLDVCCGTGSSALAAAAAVGPGGHVVGVDFAEDLLTLARAKAAARGLAHVTFEHGDMTALPYADGAFDAVVCQFGVFFVPDMAGAVAELWRVVRPGGTLAVTTWGPQCLEPGASIFWEGVAKVRPELVAVPPWQRIVTPEAVVELMVEGGVPRGAVRATPGTDVQPLADAEAFWTVVLGTGYRGVVDAMSAADAELLRADCLGQIEARSVTQLDSDVIYVTARRPG